MAEAPPSDWGTEGGASRPRAGHTSRRGWAARPFQAGSWPESSHGCAAYPQAVQCVGRSDRSCRYRQGPNCFRRVGPRGGLTLRVSASSCTGDSQWRFGSTISDFDAHATTGSHRQRDRAIVRSITDAAPPISPLGEVSSWFLFNQPRHCLEDLGDGLVRQFTAPESESDNHFLLDEHDHRHVSLARTDSFPGRPRSGLHKCRREETSGRAVCSSVLAAGRGSPGPC